LKKHSLLEDFKSNQTPIPENTFTRSEIKKPKPRVTSVRVAKDTANQLNALTNVLGYDRLNDFLDDLVYSSVNKLNPSEKELYKAYLQIVERKQSSRK
jgi:hypothetical protein